MLEYMLESYVEIGGVSGDVSDAEDQDSCTKGEDVVPGRGEIGESSCEILKNCLPGSVGLSREASQCFGASPYDSQRSEYSGPNQQADDSRANIRC